MTTDELGSEPALRRSGRGVLDVRGSPRKAPGSPGRMHAVGGAMRAVSIAGACLVLTACGSALEDHEALWKAHGPSSYRYTYATAGFAPHVQLRVTVQSHAVSSVVVLAPTEPLGTTDGFTVEQLFEDIRARLDAPCKTTSRYE